MGAVGLAALCASIRSRASRDSRPEIVLNASVLRRLKLAYRYTPLFGIAFAIASALWAYLAWFPSAGAHGDAAGAGMAVGLAFIAFHAFLLVYLAVLVPALALLRSGADWPRLAATLNALLLAPAVVALPVLALDVVVEIDRARAERAAYERFASSATTTEYRAPDGTFSFRYASSPDGLELVEDEGGVLLFERSSRDEGYRVFAGGARVRRLPGPGGDTAERLSAEYSALTGERCMVTRAEEHPLGQFSPPRYQVFTLPDDDENEACAYAYTTRLDPRSLDFGSLYVIVPEDARDVALEVVLDSGSRLITGPVEDNAPGDERVAWYDTIRLGS